jgi:Protein of unknown function (DUF559)
MDLSKAPFLGSEAVAAGVVTKRTLRSRNQLIYRNVYLPNGVELAAATRAYAAWLWSGRRATFAGLSASAVLGSKWIDARLPAELIRAEGSSNGIVIHRDALNPDEIVLRNGVSVTTPARTAFDLGRRDGRVDVVIWLDALAQATGITPAEVAELAERHRGARGLRQLRQALDVMDGGAESPPETRTRLLLADAGLRKPQTQIAVYDEGGYPFARIDMGWEQYRVGVEYDGAQHWTDSKRRGHDIDRAVELAEHGWIVIRVSADMLRNRPWVVVARAIDALRAAGCPWLAECGVELRSGRGSVA